MLHYPILASPILRIARCQSLSQTLASSNTLIMFHNESLCTFRKHDSSGLEIKRMTSMRASLSANIPKHERTSLFFLMNEAQFHDGVLMTYHSLRSVLGATCSDIFR